MLCIKETKLIKKNNYMKLLYIPNLLTTLRISLIPLFIFMFYYPSKWAFLYTTLIFAIAGITDWLDGYLARKLEQASAIGAFLDPVADKLIIVVALVLLTESHASLVMSIPVSIIICREIVISALREWVALSNKSTKVAVSYIGKIKTAVQMIAILLLLFKLPALEHLIVNIGYVFLYIAMFLTILSMCLYFKLAFEE